MAVVSDESGRTREVRWNAPRKARVVLRVLGGASLEAVAEEIDQPIGVVTDRQERFVAAGTQALRGPSAARRRKP